VALGAGQWLQLNQVLQQAGMTNGWATVERIGGTDPFYAYAVVNDNVTNDGSFVPPVALGRKTNLLMLPVAVSTGAFSTEAVLTNAGSSPLSLRLGRSKLLTLQPGEQRFISDFLPFVSEGTAPPATSVPVSVVGGAPTGFHAGARTFAAAPGGGSYGLYYNAATSNEAVWNEAWVYGLRQDDSARSNLAFATIRDEYAGPGLGFFNVTADLFDGATGALAGTVGVQLDYVGPQWKQINAVLSGFGVSNGYARIRSGGLVSQQFITYGVVNDGAAPGLGTSDGSYMWMSRSLAPSPFPQ
ncbi:MAG: hypothetical protein NEA02_09675, partial [Thermoanaerobaculia bacterium]|nr:hypothetical protein [Thermoanaerobaculia bacterium]